MSRELKSKRTVSPEEQALAYGSSTTKSPDASSNSMKSRSRSTKRASQSTTAISPSTNMSSIEAFEKKLEKDRKMIEALKKDGAFVKEKGQVMFYPKAISGFLTADNLHAIADELDEQNGFTPF
jgi:hypothetical protein